MHETALAGKAPVGQGLRLQQRIAAHYRLKPRLATRAFGTAKRHYVAAVFPTESAPLSGLAGVDIVYLTNTYVISGIFLADEKHEGFLAYRRQHEIRAGFLCRFFLPCRRRGGEYNVAFSGYYSLVRLDGVGKHDAAFVLFVSRPVVHRLHNGGIDGIEREGAVEYRQVVRKT